MWSRLRKSFLLKLGLAIGVSLVCLLLLEAGLRLGGFGEQYEFVVSGSRPQDEGKVSLNSQYVAIHYFQHLPVNLSRLFTDRPWFEDTAFSRTKQSGVFRVFMVGASTTRGFPYTDRRISYSGLLQAMLRDVLPAQRVEVINAGYDALSSFGVLDLTSQLMDYEPDLIVVYSGHNEFIGHFGANSAINYGQNRKVIRLATFLFQSRTYLAMERMALWLRSRDRGDASRNSQVNLFRAMLSKERLGWDDATHEEAERNYKANLTELVRQARQRGIQVVLSTLVSNVRSFPPVRSVFSESLSAAARQRLTGLLQQGKAALEQKDYEQAVEYFEQVIAGDARQAEAHFGLGRAYDHLQQMEKARSHYLLAREYDRLHLRACLRLNEVVEQVGREAQVPVLNMVSQMEKIASDGMPGEDLFLEHVHPNINGHMVMADGMARFLAERELIAPASHWKWERLKPAREYILQTGFNQSQYLNAQYTIGRLYLDFPFYQCRKGISVLQKIGKAEEEQALINNCLSASGKESSIDVD
ncbi:tetratricopeptide repeat protein [Nitrospina watsonii]|nr:tetratricopeptide repeat protein [Nitrospina watsonii]